MKAGRTVASNLSGDSPDRQIVGRVKGDRLTEGLVGALADALRRGVPLRYLPDQVLYSAGSVHVSIDTRKQQLDDVHRALATAETHAKSAAAKSVAAHSQGDLASEEDWDRERREARTEATRLRSVLASLERPLAEPAKFKSFDVLDDVWLPALRRIASTNILSQEERNALEIIIPGLKFEYDGGDWFGSATLRINTSIGVAELGPIRWRCSTGFTTPSSVVDLPPSPVTSEGRSAALMELALLQTGRMTAHAAHVVVHAKALPQLKYVLLNQLCGEKFPATVSAQWRDPLFVKWVTKVYTDPTLGAGRKRPGRYTTLSVTRQFVAWLVAKRGAVTQSELRAAMGVSERDHSELDRARHEPGSFDGPWYPPVRVTKTGRSPDKIVYEAVMCVCGSPASIVARVAEVPRDLLCACGLMPDAELYGMPPGVKFPDEYKNLAPSMSQCLAEIKRREDPMKRPGPTSLLFLGHLAARTEGVRQCDLAKAFDSKGVSQAVRKMRSRGLLESHGEGQKALWIITDLGRKVLKAHTD